MAEDKKEKPAKAPKADKPAVAKEKPKEKSGAKKGGKGRKDEAKKVAYAATVEAGLEIKPARLKLRYRAEVVPALMKEFGFKNPNQVPKLEKITLNMGL